MNNDDRLSSGLNIDMCIEQIESKMSDDIMMQQIYISLCAYKIEIEKLQNENKKLKEELEISKNLNICVGCENNPDYKSRCEKAIDFVKKESKKCYSNQITDNPTKVIGNFMWHTDKLLNILNGDEE